MLRDRGSQGELQAGVSHAGITPYTLPNDVSQYPLPAARPSPRVQSSRNGKEGGMRHRSKSRGRDEERERAPHGEPMDISTSSSSPSSVASHHHRPRRVIYRDPDFDFDDSSSSPRPDETQACVRGAVWGWVFISRARIRSWVIILHRILQQENGSVAVRAQKRSNAYQRHGTRTQNISNTASSILQK